VVDGVLDWLGLLRGASGMLVVVVEVLVLEAELRRVDDIAGVLAGNLDTVTVLATGWGDVLGRLPFVRAVVVAVVGDRLVCVAVIVTVAVDEFDLDLLALGSLPLEGVLLAALDGITLGGVRDLVAGRLAVTGRRIVITIVVRLAVVALRRVLGVVRGAFVPYSPE